MLYRLKTEATDLKKMGIEKERDTQVYAGWVYHVGSNSVGYQFCRLRYLVIKGKYVEMYKRDPTEDPNLKPIRRGIAGRSMMVEEVGRQIYHGRAVYVLKIYSLVNHNKHGEIACNSAEEAEKWISAFQHAKEEAEFDIRSTRRFINNEAEFKLNGRKNSRSYARGLIKLIYIGRGPESVLGRPAVVAQEPGSDEYYKQGGDAVEQADWRCIRTVNGLRIFEDVAASKADKGTIMKSVGVVDATPDMIFEMIISLDKSQRYQWDTLTGELELVEHIDGHSDIVYGTFDPKYFKRWNSFFGMKRDFIFSRYWRRDQDGSYYINQTTVTHKNRPPRRHYCRIILNTGIWEISPLSSKPMMGPRSLVTQIIEIKSTGWGRWKKSHYSKFHTTVPYALLLRTAGLREFFAAENEMRVSTPVAYAREIKKAPGTTMEECQSQETNEQFYDAIMAEDSPEDDDSEEERKPLNKAASKSHKFRSVSWSVMLGLSHKKPPGREDNGELVLNCPPVDLDISCFKGSLCHARDDRDHNCWDDPGGKGFMVRGKTYIKDYLKVPAGDPLLKLLAVDWLKSASKISALAKHPNSVVQSDAGRKLPFILIVNLQVPAKPNYSLAFYFGADRPIRPGSILDRFVNGDDAFRNARFKLIPSIAEGYWVVKRAVGTKACLLGRAVTCNYIREDNFLEIDVDIGSSSVARSVVGLVLGYVTNVVVDLAILIEAKEEEELPEYLLGTVRVDRVVPETAKLYL